MLLSSRSPLSRLNITHISAWRQKPRRHSSNVLSFTGVGLQLPCSTSRSVWIFSFGFIAIKDHWGWTYLCVRHDISPALLFAPAVFSVIFVSAMIFRLHCCLHLPCFLLSLCPPWYFACTVVCTCRVFCYLCVRHDISPALLFVPAVFSVIFVSAMIFRLHCCLYLPCFLFHAAVFIHLRSLFSARFKLCTLTFV